MTVIEDDILELPAFLPYRLSVLSNRISADIARAYEARFGLTMPEWRVMAVVGAEPGLSAREVAERTAMDKVAVSRAVKRLIDAGHLTREFAADDRRRSALRLSPKGRGVYRRIVPLAKRYERRILAELSKTDRATLDRLLTRLAAAQRDAHQGLG